MTAPTLRPTNPSVPAAPPSPALPVATYALLVAQVLVWLAVTRYMLDGDDWLTLALRPGAPGTLGMLLAPFVHVDPAHLGVNLAVLWLFGVNLERALGSLRFLALYLAAAWFSALMQWAVFSAFHLNPSDAVREAAIGSSGAIAGILGASLVRFPQDRLTLPLPRGSTFPTAPLLMLWFVYTVLRATVTTVHGVNEGVAHWAHFAGFILGLGAAQLMGLERIARQEYLEAAWAEAARQGNQRAAAQARAALLLLRPDDLPLRVSLIRDRLALGDLPGARRLTREAIEAAVLGERRDVAVTTYLTLVELGPSIEVPPRVRFRLACWLAEAGQGEAAYRELLRCAAEEASASAAAAALFRAGQVAWETLRSSVQAQDAWERLLQQFPDSSWSDQARDGLRRSRESLSR